MSGGLRRGDGNRPFRRRGVRQGDGPPAPDGQGQEVPAETFVVQGADVFGGGTLYSMDKNLVAVALVLALDWKYADLNPQQELQVFKSHPYVQRILEGGEVIAYDGDWKQVAHGEIKNGKVDISR